MTRKRHKRHHHPQRLAAGSDLPDTRLWYVVDGDLVVHGRIPYMPYREALAIARAILPAEMEHSQLLIYANLSRQMLRQAEDAPLLSERAAVKLSSMAGGGR